MASKLQIIKDAYNHQLEHVTQSPAEWTAFLRAAARNYKLPFDEQMLVYAQRPSAAAVLELERWNELFGRWVNAGSTGIAVFDRSAAKPRLKYYFDIADTYETLFARPVPLWEITPEAVPDVMETLRNSYGPSDGETEAETLEEALMAAASALVEDNLPDYSEQLAGLDESFDQSLYRQAVLCGVAYMLLSRCGIEPDALDMSWVHRFNTPELVNLLGAATGDIAEMGLREIAAAVIPLQKNSFRTFANDTQSVYTQTIPAEERTDNHGQSDLHPSERLQHPEPGPAPAAGGRAEPLGPGAAELPEGAQERAAHAHDDPTHPVAALAGDAGNGGGAVRPADPADGRGRGRGRSAQGQRPNAVGRTDGQHPAESGGTGEAGAYLQLSLFATPEEQIAKIEEAEAAKAAAFSVPVEELDRELTHGSSYADGKYRIYKHFQEPHTPEENAAFLKKEYGIGGHSQQGGSEFRVATDGKGLLFRKGSLLHPDEEHRVPWPKVAQRVRDLIALDRFLTPFEQEHYPDYLEHLDALAVQRQKREFISAAADLPPEEKRDTLALRLADFLDGLERYEKAFLGGHGLPELAEAVDTQRIDTLLRNPRQTQRLMEALAAIQGGTADVFTRANAWRFGLELIELHPRQYVYQSGDSVYIDGGQRSIAYADERVVRLANPEFPLSGEELPRGEFERQLRESPHNNRFLVLVDTPEQATNPETPRILYKKYLPLLLEDLRVSDIFSYLRDSDSYAEVAYDQIHNWVFTASLDADAYPGLMEALGLPEFQNWLDEDLFQRTYQDVVVDRENQLEQHERRQDAPEWAQRPPLPEQVREELYLRGFVVSEELIADGLEDYRARGEHGGAEAIAGFIEMEYLSEDEPEPEADIFKRTERDAFNEYSILFIQRVLRDEPYLNAYANADAENARIECDAAVDRAALHLGAENMELYKLFHDAPGFRQRMCDYVFDRTYTQTKRAIQRVLRPPAKRATTEQRNFRFLSELAPEILSGEADYLHLTAGAGMMPLFIDRLSDNRLAIAHQYTQNGDVIADPDMEFVFDRESRTLSARTFQQGNLGIFQQVEGDNGGINHALERQLNSFTAQWFRNIRDQGYRRELMNVRFEDDELELVYAEDGSVQYINGEVTLAERYAREHGIVLPAEKETAPAPQPQPGPGEAPERPAEPSGDDLPAEPHEAEHTPPQSLLAVEAELDRKVELMLEHPDYEKIKEAAGFWKTWRNMSHRVGVAANVLVSQINALEDQQAYAWFSGVPWDNWREALDIGDFEPLSEKIHKEDNAPEHPSVPPAPEEEDVFDPQTMVGHEVVFEGRRFRVDGIDPANGKVSLLDLALYESGMPIFREEPAESIRWLIEHENDPPVPPPDLAPNQHVEKIGGTEFVVTTPAIGPKAPRRLRHSGVVFPGEIEIRKVHIPQPEDSRHNFRITDDNMGHGGAKAKFRMNADAISLLKDLEFDQRLATPEEQGVLSRYVGWGGLAQAFDPDNKQWETEYLELNALLSPEEFAAARASTLNAHYTSPTVIRAMYKAIEYMGFTAGNILEPSCGIGNFFGLVPESMSASKLYGIELDPITGRIAQQLYQNVNIAVQGFESAELPDSFFDLAVGNVPFGEYSVSDRRYDRHKFSIHDYFFAKTLDKVRPGGVVAFITSKYTMDKKDPAVRKYIAQRAELLGAIRLPNNAFKANAGTEVTTDIIFLQKRDRALEVAPDWVSLGQTEDGIAVNSYFMDHPEMMLGEMTTESTQYGHDTTCRPFPGRDLADLLGEAVQNIHAEIADYERGDQQETEGAIPADPSVRNFSYTVHNGGVYYRENSIMLPQELSATAQSRVKGMIGIRDCARRLIEWQTENAPDDIIQREQARLNRLYDTFTAKYGLLSDRANASVFRDDDSYPLLGSLEVLDKDGNLERKADMFTKRTIRAYTPITHVDTAAEALTVSIAEKARVDLDFMEQLSGLNRERLIADLEGAIFRVPNSDPIRYVTADEYLSGNVREKLAQAREATAVLPEYEVNVKALEAAQPKDLTASEISVRLGATWVPTDVVQDFIFELLEPGYWAKREIQVHYSQYTAEWNITGKSVDKNSIAARVTYGTDCISAYHIIEQTLNLRTVKVFDTVYDGEKEKRVLNPKETAIAQGKQEIIKAKFLDWVWADPYRRERLCGIYNSLYNSTRPREYDGSHLIFPGMNPEKQLDAHQKNGVARHLYGGNTLFAHVVGAGKTFTMVAAAMESKRLGLSHKAMFIVPNNIVGQFASEFLQLYPSANVLMVTARDFEKQNRKKFCARVATGDYDGIVMAHSQFEKLAMSTEWQEDFLQQQVDDLADGIAEMKEQSGERMTVKQMEKTRKSLQVKIQKLNEQDRKDGMLTFEELGVDLLFVDEADLYKNLMIVTKMRNVAGIGQSDAQKASDLFMKTRYLDQLTGRRGVVFATGTPVSNTMAEMYTMQRYLQYDTLVEHGLEHFDCWASTFGETVTAMELAPEGTGFRMKTRFARFYNLPELMSMFREVADIQTADMLNLPTPKVTYHIVAAKPSEQQQEMVQGLAERADLIRRRKVDPKQDNMLLVTNDGRKLALDQRLVNPLLPDVPGSKVNLCVENIHRIWQDTAEKRLTQLGFVDLSTPKDGIEFDVYHDVKEKLLLRGVPADEIAFIHEAKNEAQKQALFGRVRTGAVRVLLGSTSKMGAGTNVQDLIIAMHDLDCPWRPRDLEQREGRGRRRGNTNPEIDLFRYVTEGTFDSYLYQLNETKQRFISQVFTSKSPERVMQDVDETVLNYAQVKALATGDERIMEMCTLEAEVSRLKLLKSSFMSERYALQDSAMKYLPARISRIEQKIRGYEADAALAAHTSPASAEHFAPMVVEGKTYTTPKDAGFAILEACKGCASKEPVPLGAYRGFALELSWNMRWKKFELHIVGQGRCEIDLGTDARGNISRIDNALADFPAELQCSRRELEEAQQQLAAALAEKDKPFPQEAELAEKSARLGELKAALQMDEREPVIFADDTPDEGDGPAGPQRKKEMREER